MAHTHTTRMTATLLNALRESVRGNFASIKPAALKTLVERGYLACRVTAEGFGVLGERPYIVEQWVQTDITKGAWARVPSRTGEPLVFAKLDAAERFAAQVSVLGEAARVVALDDAPPNVFPVYVYGQRHMEDRGTGLRTRLPEFEVEDDAPDTPLLVIQVRQVIGDEIGAWQDTSTRRYADYDMAVLDAKGLAREAKDSSEFRVAYADAPDLPRVVYTRDGVRDDLGLKREE